MMTTKGNMMTDKGKTHEILSGSLKAPKSDFKDHVEYVKEPVKSENTPAFSGAANETRQEAQHEFSCRGLQFWYGNLKLEEPHTIFSDKAAAFIQMNFSVRNTCSYHLEKEKKPFAEFNPQEHNLLFMPASRIAVKWEACEEIELFIINLSPDFFSWYLPEELSHLSGFMDSIKKNIPAQISKKNLPLTARMLSTLYEILHCPHQGNLRNIVVEAKVAELLNLQLELCQQSNQCHLLNGLKKEEAEKMQLARDIIVSRLDCPPSLKELAHTIGTNEHYLKTQFKQLFGTTVFGYLQNYKMEKSREMLAGGEKINDIAMTLGYKHATHFTAAFKKHFGFLPHKIKAS